MSSAHAYQGSLPPRDTKPHTMESSNGLHPGMIIASRHQPAATELIPDPSSLPIRIHRSFPEADITVQCFANRLVITCSQREGKIGSWLYCKPPSITSAGGLYTAKGDHDWEVTHLLGSGRDDPFGTVFCRRVAQLLSQDEGFPVRPLLFGLSLHQGNNNNNNSDRDRFTTLVDLVVPTVLAVAVEER